MLIIQREHTKLFRGKSVIYGLRCPLSNQIRYIGKSTSGMDRAFEHLRTSSRKEGNTRKNNWLNKIISLGLQPTVVMLDSFSNITNDELYKIEQTYIEFYKPFGFLTNLTDGGPGMTGHKYSIETRKKMSLSAKKRPLPKALIDNQKKAYPSGSKNERFCKKCNQILPEIEFCRKNGFLCKKHVLKKEWALTDKRINAFENSYKFLVIMKPLDGPEIWFKGYKKAALFLGGKANKTGIRLAVMTKKLYYGCRWEIQCRQ